MDLEPSKQHPEKLHLREVTYALFFLSLLVTCFILFSNMTTSPLIRPTYSVNLPIGLWSQFISSKNHQNSSSSSSSSSTSSSYKANCDYSDGRWIFDPSYPLQTYREHCPFLDPGFRCHHSGRPDGDYAKWRWQPHGCDLPRFNATDFLERSRNGQIAFAGDSIGRNQWESLLCMLSQGVSNISTIYEENGSPITKHKGFLSIRFQEYNLTVQYYRVPFLVEVHRPPENYPPAIRKAIRVDSLHWFSTKFVRADVLIFNAGHWWNQDTTIKMGWYFQEGRNINMTMDVATAFQKSLQTLKSWIMQNLNLEKSHIFFRSYSPTHFRNGTWNEGGYCDKYKEPEKDQAKIEGEPLTNKFIYEVVKQMEGGDGGTTKELKVKYLNITYLTEVRKDGHPSRHREPGTPPGAPQDCSHWCLPGVPDTWNQLLYAHLLSMGFRTR